MKKVYLGDSVYASFDGYHVILTTENGYPDDPRNTIAIDDEVYASLRDFWAFCHPTKGAEHGN